tara:strand:+ start:605 stop:2656 length:2052 start_codon:yes stop_codon:yes gene_type:complete
MNFLGTIALGYIQEQNKIMQEASAAKSEEAKLSAAFSRDKQLIDYRITKENEQAENTWQRESDKRSDDAFMNWIDGLEDEALAAAYTSDTVMGRLKKITGMEGSLDVFNTANLISETDTKLPVKGSGGEVFKWDLVGELEYGSGGSPYKRAQVLWNSWSQQLSTEEGYNAALDFFQKNETARENMETLVKRNEYNLRMGNLLAQKNVDNPGDIRYIDLTENYGPAARLFDELGFKNVEESTLKAIGDEIIDVADDEEAILFPTRDTSMGGIKGGIFLPVNKTDITTMTDMAKRAGYESAQQMVAGFSYRAGERQDDMSDEDFARQQNAILFKAVKLERLGYGEKLSNMALMSKEDYQNLYNELQTTFGKDKQGMIQALSLLTQTPTDTFTKTVRYRYSGNVNQKSQVIGTGAEFVNRITGLDTDDFNEGFKAQEEAVAYLDRLERLEEDLSEEVGTGWVRTQAKILKTIGIQIQQGARALGTLFSENSDFAATDENTTLRDLQAVIQKVRPGIDLGAISEAEAIRLTLAAKMARAVDPAGRLSNQDFEIQLRRLGEATFTSPESISRAIRLVRKEFDKDIAFKSMLKGVSDDQTKLTPQVARTVQAHITYRTVERNLFGVKGLQGVAQEQKQETEEGTGTVKTTKSSRTLNGSPLYRGDDNKYYLDPEAKQPVPSDQIKNISR